MPEQKTHQPVTTRTANDQRLHAVEARQAQVRRSLYLAHRELEVIMRNMGITAEELAELDQQDSEGSR